MTIVNTPAFRLPQPVSGKLIGCKKEKRTFNIFKRRKVELTVEFDESQRNSFRYSQLEYRTKKGEYRILLLSQREKLLSQMSSKDYRDFKSIIGWGKAFITYGYANPHECRRTNKMPLTLLRAHASHHV